MRFEELLSLRQSCRNYDAARPVAEEDVLTCARAMRLAPSACNAQPYHITVCRGDLAVQVAKCTQGMGMNAFASNAPCFFVVSEGAYNATARAGSKLKDQDYRSVDIGIAVAQMTLQAADLGLGTCILGWFDEKKLMRLLGLDGRVRVVIALGHPVEGDPIRPKVRKDLEDLVSFKDTAAE